MIQFVILIAAVFVDSYIPRSGESYSGEPGWMKLKSKEIIFSGAQTPVCINSIYIQFSIGQDMPRMKNDLLLL